MLLLLCALAATAPAPASALHCVKGSSSGAVPYWVGIKAPDFKATAVYDQEFMDVSLSDYTCAPAYSQNMALKIHGEYALALAKSVGSACGRALPGGALGAHADGVC